MACEETSVKDASEKMESRCQLVSVFPVTCIYILTRGQMEASWKGSKVRRTSVFQVAFAERLLTLMAGTVI